MKRFERFATQRGVTLAELVAVIVLLGILSAIAVPNIADVTDDAKKSKASAIYGSLKASYAVQSSIKKGGAVSVAEIVAGHDPSCSDGTSVSQTCGNAVVVFGSSATVVTAPSTWTCTVSDIATSTSCKI